jgi:hypothetical protein
MSLQHRPCNHPLCAQHPAHENKSNLICGTLGSGSSTASWAINRKMIYTFELVELALHTLQQSFGERDPNNVQSEKRTCKDHVKDIILGTLSTLGLPVEPLV